MATTLGSSTNRQYAPTPRRAPNLAPAAVSGVSAASPAVPALIEEAQRAERAGRRELARRSYEMALYLLGDGEGALAASILRRVGRSYLDEGRFTEAEDCLEAALATARALRSPSDVAQAINSLASIALVRGDLDAAEQQYRAALEVARRAGDRQLEAMISQNLGIIANTHGNSKAALGYYQSSVAIYRELEMGEYVGLVLNNIGMSLAKLERWVEAESAYAEALTWCTLCSDVPARLMVMVNLTEMWLARGNHEMATRACEQAMHQATEAQDQRALGETLKHRGTLARQREDYETAERELHEAYENADRRQDLLLAAETAREQAELFLALDRSREALHALSLSHRLFSRLRAQQDVADLRRRMGRLEARFVDVVRHWAESIEAKDPYTRGHCERVAAHACELARQSGIDEVSMFWFHIGALLHDVGKIDIPAEILNKPGRLTDGERRVIESHPRVGCEMLADVDFPWDVLPMVRSHHERWDGHGYPDQLSGQQIPLAARILTVADVYDALTTDRPYRAGFAQADALAIMEADSGKMFDPRLFDTFKEILRKHA